MTADPYPLDLKGLSLREVTGDVSALPAIGRLRVAAWRARVASFPAMDSWLDELDESARHWALYDTTGQAVAAARLSQHRALHEVPGYEVYPSALAGRACPIASLNRLVVHPAWAGRGLAAILDRVRIDRARRSGARTLVMRTHPQRGKALEAIGFVNLGTALPYASGPLVGLSSADVIMAMDL